MVFLFATLSKAYLLTSQSGNFWCVVYIYIIRSACQSVVLSCLTKCHKIKRVGEGDCLMGLEMVVRCYVLDR